MPSSYASKPLAALVAIVAVAGSIPTAAYFMLTRGTDYRELGPDYLQRDDRQHAARRLVRRLSDLGFHVDLGGAA